MPEAINEASVMFVNISGSIYIILQALAPSDVSEPSELKTS
jgi:hypothetical protein